MTSTNNTTDQAFARLAEGLLDTIAGMVTARDEYAAERGMTVTDDEIVASVRASLVRMIAAEVK
jgi:hypothetical protein